MRNVIIFFISYYIMLLKKYSVIIKDNKYIPKYPKDNPYSWKNFIGIASCIYSNL